MSTKAFTAQVFRWLYQVNEDHRLPASAAKVAIYLAPKFNEDEGGAAWPSCKTIADAIGRSEGTVINAVHALGDRGHLRVEWGKQGRGHSNRYWMIGKDQQADLFDAIKPQPAKVFEPAGKPQSTKIKPQLLKRKPQPAEETLSKTHLIEEEGSKRASHARAKPPDFASPGRSKKEPPREARKEESKNQAAVADGFARFWASYPRKANEVAARAAFDKAVAGGADIERVVTRAAVYALERADAIAGGDLPKWTPYPAKWLKERKFNEPMPDGMIIDQAGNFVAFEQPQQQSSGRGFATIAEELNAELAALGKEWF